MSGSVSEMPCRFTISDNNAEQISAQMIDTDHKIVERFYGLSICLGGKIQIISPTIS